jgi:NADH-quinone oxidoreductase subunit M
LLILALVAAGVLGIGLWPKPLADVMAPSVDNLVIQITQSKLELSP